MKNVVSLSLLLGALFALPSFASDDDEEIFLIENSDSQVAFHSSSGDRNFVRLNDPEHDLEYETNQFSPYTYVKPKYAGSHFHRSVPAAEICRRLHAGPPDLTSIYYGTIGLSGVWIPGDRNFRTLRLALKPGGSYVKSITCTPPNLELATEFVRVEVAKLHKGWKVDHQAIGRMVLLHPSLKEMLPKGYY